MFTGYWIIYTHELSNGLVAKKGNCQTVTGTLPDDSIYIYMGGVPCLVIQKDDGKVIAVWHDK
jgi:hypothetical protein